MKNSARSENSRKSLNSIGLSSLLVIFVVLASVTLSVMCLITVRQDLDRAKKTRRDARGILLCRH